MPFYCYFVASYFLQKQNYRPDGGTVAKIQKGGSAMDQMDGTGSLSSGLTVEQLLRGVLTLEQGQARKVFKSLQDGLENLVAQKLIPTSAAKEFRQMRAKILKGEKKMEKVVFKKADYRTSLGDLTCEVVRQLDKKIGLTVGAETLCAVIKTDNTKFQTSDGEGSSVAIETHYSYRRVSNNELARDGSISLIWNTRSDHTVEISESWSGIPSLGGFVVVKIGDDESEQFYPSVINLLGEIPLMNEKYVSGEEKIIVAIGDKFRYNGRDENIGPSMTYITLDQVREIIRAYPEAVIKHSDRLSSYGNIVFEKFRKKYQDPRWGDNQVWSTVHAPANILHEEYEGNLEAFFNDEGWRGIFIEIPHKIFDEWLNRPPFVHKDWA